VYIFVPVDNVIAPPRSNKFADDSPGVEVYLASYAIGKVPVTPVVSIYTLIDDIDALVKSTVGRLPIGVGLAGAVDIGTGLDETDPTAFVAVATKSYTVFGVRPDAVAVYTVPTGAVKATGTLAPPPVL
jgi:hypothetical protein